MNRPDAATAAAIAVHRFGLGEPSLSAPGDDAAGWLRSQIGPADGAAGSAGASLPDGAAGTARAWLPDSADGLRAQLDYQRLQRQRRLGAPPQAPAGPVGRPNNSPMAPPGGVGEGTRASPPAAASMDNPGRASEQAFADHFRPLVVADLRARLGGAASTQRPFAERLALFWANHFTVSMAKASVRGLVGSFEREAIRPHIAGRFETMLKAAVTHPAMLRYLDNELSAGPQSAIVRRLARSSRPDDAPGLRLSGLNENLAREVLELHTLGVAGGGAAAGGWGGYTQADVTAFAAVLTGWRVPLRALADERVDAATLPRFDPSWHQPGEKHLLGRRYPEGPEALDAVLHDLAVHPSTARFIAHKLARHFVADTPPPALVARLAEVFQATQGDLPSVYRALVDSPLAWDPALAKLKTPEEFVIGSARLLGLGAAAFQRPPDGGVGLLGQRVQAAPSPAGWPDRAEDWLGPDAVWKRVEWATRVARLAGGAVDARALAGASLGPRLSAATAREIGRAADGPQALALLLMAPEFQRR